MKTFFVSVLTALFLFTSGTVMAQGKGKSKGPNESAYEHANDKAKFLRDESAATGKDAVGQGKEKGKKAVAGEKKKGQGAVSSETQKAKGAVSSGEAKKSQLQDETKVKETKTKAKEGKGKATKTGKKTTED